MNDIDAIDADKCYICGEIIPEGSHLCPQCTNITYCEIRCRKKRNRKATTDECVEAEEEECTEN